jgi:hypothetical protein
VINGSAGASFNAKHIKGLSQLRPVDQDEETRVIEEGSQKEYDPDRANETHYVSVDGILYRTR